MLEKKNHKKTQKNKTNTKPKNTPKTKTAQNT
jgi:hypothetical protein